MVSCSGSWSFRDWVPKLELGNQRNDTPDDANKLGEILAGKSAYINLIPFNAFPGSHYQRPDLDKIEQFKEVLDTFKIPTLIRSAKGDDVLAACGQLNSKN